MSIYAIRFLLQIRNLNKNHEFYNLLFLAAPKRFASHIYFEYNLLQIANVKQKMFNTIDLFKQKKKLQNKSNKKNLILIIIVRFVQRNHMFFQLSYLFLCITEIIQQII